MDATQVMHEMFDSSSSPHLRSGRNSHRRDRVLGIGPLPGPLPPPPAPPTIRFVQEQVGVGAIGPCKGKDAPKNAECLFCTGAAYYDYWDSKRDSCEDYTGEANKVCKGIAGAVKGKAKKSLGEMYKAFGPQFGASTVFCREGGCCIGKPPK